MDFTDVRRRGRPYAGPISRWERAVDDEVEAPLDELEADDVDEQVEQTLGDGASSKSGYNVSAARD